MQANPGLRFPPQLPIAVSWVVAGEELKPFFWLDLFRASARRGCQKWSCFSRFALASASAARADWQRTASYPALSSRTRGARIVSSACSGMAACQISSPPSSAAPAPATFGSTPAAAAGTPRIESHSCPSADQCYHHPKPRTDCHVQPSHQRVR